MLKQIILSFTLLILSTNFAHATQACRASSLTKDQAIERYDNIVVVKVKSSFDQTEWFSENFKENYKDQPEEQKHLEEMFIAYVTYETTVLESFKGSLEGEIKLAEIRTAFSSHSSALVSGFYYILGIDKPSDDEINFLPKNVILMPECATISIGFNKYYGDFLDKVDEFRK